MNLGKRSYDIEIDAGSILQKDFSQFARRFAIITDTTVKKLYGEDLKSSLERQGR
jgi:3-dehydroquinate synthetase